MRLHGRAWKFRDNISTDDIAPGRYFHLRSDLAELAKHALEAENAGFAAQVRQGDFVVGGANFGLGSSREHAPAILKVLGVGAILAPSFARIFFRNAINVGLPLVVTDTEGIDQGDELEIDLEQGWAKNRNKNTEAIVEKIPPFMLEILNHGGLVAYLKEKGDFVMPKSR